MRRLYFIAGISLLLAAAAHADDQRLPPEWPVAEFKNLLKPAEVTAETRAETARLIRDLTSNDFAVRERASNELATRGVDAFPGLRKAAGELGDAELTARTAEYFKLGHFNVPVIAPTRVVDMVREYEQARSSLISQLTRDDTSGNRRRSGDAYRASDWQMKGEFGELFLQIVRPQETAPILRVELDRLRDARALSNARLAIAAGNLDEAERILLSVIDQDGACEDYIALRALREGAALDPVRELSRLNPDDKSRPVMEALLYQCKGDLAHASALAPALPEAANELGRRLLIEAGNYDALAKYLQTPRQDGNIIHQQLICYTLTGEQGRIQEVLKSKPATSSYNVPFIQMDRAEEAIAVSKAGADRQNVAFHLLCGQLRIREALATIKDRKNADMELPQRLVEMGLPWAARNLLKDMQPDQPDPRSYSTRTVFHYAHQLSVAGMEKEATEWRTKGFELYGPLVRTRDELEKKRMDLRSQYDKLDPQADKIGRQLLSKMMLDVQVKATEYRGFTNPPILYDIYTNSGPQASREAMEWFENILKEGTPDLRERYEKLLSILQGKLPDAEIDRLLNVMVSQYANRDMASSFHRMHRDDLALELMRRDYAAHRDPACWAPLGDIALDNHDPALAASYYQRAAVTNLTDATLMWRLGKALSLVPGKEKAGKELTEYSPFLVLANYSKACALADAMRQFAGDAVADTWFESFTRRYSSMQVYEMGDSIAIARDKAEAGGDLGMAIELQKKLFLSRPFLRTNSQNSSAATMLNVAAYHRLRALEALTRKDFATVSDALWREMDDGPPDVTLLEKVVPALKAADRAAALRVLDRAAGRLRDVVEDYPEAMKYRDELRRVEALR